MQDFNPGLDFNQRHGFLASKQGTQKPVLPIHTDTEHKLFRTLMSEDPNFNNANGPMWKLAVKVWNRAAENNSDISYKLMEQLKAYYNDWKTNLNIKQTLSLTIENWKIVHNLVRHPQCSLYISAAPHQQMQPHTVTSGLRSISPMDVDQDFDTEANAMSTGFSDSVESSDPKPGPSFQSQSVRVAQVIASRSLKKPGAKATRKGRTCRKCAKTNCPGKKEVKLCHNNCQDCGLVKCRGRNPRKPAKTCAAGWEDE
jgi:hypothetical protein